MHHSIAFLFDMDGVLIDNMKTHEESWLSLFEDLGVKISAKEFHEKTAGMKAVEVLRYFLGSSLRTADAVRYAEQKEFLYRTLFRRKLKPIRGLIKFLNAAKRLNIPMAVATGGGADNIRFVMEGLSLRPYFKSILGAGDVKQGKPHPEIYLRSAKNVGVKPQHCLVFEDALPGIEAARRADMNAVALTTTLPKKYFQTLDNVIRVEKDFTTLKPTELLLH
jgi:beta-phosphoglucomutase